MKDAKFLDYSPFGLLVVFLIAVSLICGPSMAQEQTEKLTITVDIFSGRPNPSFEVTEASDINHLRDNLTGLPELGMTAEEGFEFNRLGYRGILVTNSGGIEGIPRYVQFLNGKVKVLSGTNKADARFFRDVQGMEKYYLCLAKNKGLISQDLLDNKIVPDPDAM